jgi:hypothetical protein
MLGIFLVSYIYKSHIISSILMMASDIFSVYYLAPIELTMKALMWASSVTGTPPQVKFIMLIL